MYFKIGTTDLSNYVAELKVNNKANYVAQTNANGDTVIDYRNNKREIEVSIIPLSNSEITAILPTLTQFSCSVSYREPKTGSLVSNISCICPTNQIEYYTIQNNHVMLKQLTLKYIEL